MKQVSTQEVVHIWRLREGALKGDARACLLALAGAHNSADGDQAVAGPTAAEDQAILAAYAEFVRVPAPRNRRAPSAPPVTGEGAALELFKPFSAYRPAPSVKPSRR